MQERDKKIFVFIGAFALGIIISSYISIAPIWSVFIILLSFIPLYFKRFTIFIILIALALGSLRYEVKDFHTPNPTFETHIGERMDFTGIVTDEPEKRDADTRIIVRSGNEKVLVSTDIYADIKYGDEVRVSGKLMKPGIITSDTGTDFDYAAYLSREDIYYTMSFAHVDVMAEGRGNKVKSLLLEVKHGFIEKIKNILPEPEASLLSGLLVAGKEALPKSIVEEFRKAGVVHIVVLSGYNITVVAEFLRRIFGLISLRAGSAGSLLGIFIFVLMAGATPSIIRAAIMALAAVGGKMFGRNYSAPRALFAAAFIMILINPKILVYDPSFKLSFLATMGMIYLTPIFQKFLTKRFLIANSPMLGREQAKNLWLIELISISLATQVAVTPYILYSMGNVSVVSLISNILILPLVPFTMLIGFISVLLAYVSSMIALPLAYVTHLLLVYILDIAHFMSNLPFATISL